jgi:hypothetical protein
MFPKHQSARLLRAGTADRVQLMLSMSTQFAALK